VSLERTKAKFGQLTPVFAAAASPSEVSVLHNIVTPMLCVSPLHANSAQKIGA